MGSGNWATVVGWDEGSDVGHRFVGILVEGMDDGVAVVASGEGCAVGWPVGFIVGCEVGVARGVPVG